MQRLQILSSLMFLAIFTLGFGCSHKATKPLSGAYDRAFDDQQFVFADPPLVGMNSEVEPIKLGGFSGLMYLGADSKTGDLLFRTHTDRGPNGEAVDVDENMSGRPFALPSFQPRWLDLRVSPGTNEIKLEGETLLQDPNGDPLTGRPPIVSYEDDREDEVPMDIHGKKLEKSFWGADLEAIAKDAQGRFWMGDEYLPSLMVFAEDGRLIKRFYPKNAFPWRETLKIRARYGSRKIMNDNLPQIYNLREANRGFEGLAIDGDKLYAALQSPLDIDDAKSKKLTRILQFSLETESVSGEFLYRMENEDHRLGDMATLAPGRLLVIEQNAKTGRSGFHRIYEVNCSNATNLNTRKRFGWRPPEKETEDTLADLQVKYCQKKEVLNLVAKGYDEFDKVEGLAVINSSTIAVINDNDFAIKKIDIKQGKLELNDNRKTVLGIFRID